MLIFSRHRRNVPPEVVLFEALCLLFAVVIGICAGLGVDTLLRAEQGSIRWYLDALALAFLPLAGIVMYLKTPRAERPTELALGAGAAWIVGLLAGVAIHFAPLVWSAIIGS